MRTELVGFPETCLGGKEVVALGDALVLLELRPHTVCLGGATDACGQFVLNVGHRLRLSYILAKGNRELFLCLSHQNVHHPLPPAGESCIVHGDFSCGIEGVPGLNLNRKCSVDCLKEEIKAAQRRRLVSIAVNGREIG